MRNILIRALSLLLSLVVLSVPALAETATLYAADAHYDISASYDAVSEALRVSVSFTGETKLDMASFAFYANTDKMTFASIIYADGIGAVSEDGIGYYKNENGVIADQWYVLGGIDASDGIKVCDIIYNMTKENYKSFNIEEDFVYSYDVEFNSFTTDGNVHFYVPHIASFDVESKGITMNVPTDSSELNVSLTYDSTRCSVEFEKTAKPLESISFKVNSFADEILSSVTYRTSASGNEVQLYESNGVYTIPADAVVSDVYITVTHEVYEIGDVNGDKKINIADVTRLLKYCVDSDTEIIVKAADVNSDKIINSADCSALLKLLVQN